MALHVAQNKLPLLLIVQKCAAGRGGDLGGTGERSPQNLRFGDGLCIRPPIF